LKLEPTARINNHLRLPELYQQNTLPRVGACAKTDIRPAGQTISFSFGKELYKYGLVMGKISIFFR